MTFQRREQRCVTYPRLNTKDLVEKLDDNGLTPYVYYEGVWDQRLDHLTQLPKGRTVGLFQDSDIFKVKEKLGDVMCIIGGMPISMLKSSSLREVEIYTEKICKEIGQGGGFIFSTSVGEMEGCDFELVRKWIECVKEYGRY